MSTTLICVFVSTQPMSNMAYTPSKVSKKLNIFTSFPNLDCLIGNPKKNFVLKLWVGHLSMV